MRNILFNSLVLATFSFCLSGGCAALAQAPNPGQNPTMPQSPTPQSTAPVSGSPNINGPTMPGNNPEPTTTKFNDKKFVKDAALGGMTEVELGKLAAQKASSDQVKQFGQKMVDDHTKANDELKQVASNDKMPIPDSLDSKHQSQIDKLSKLSGPDFDKAYLKAEIKDHRQDVDEFQDEAQGGSDPNVKQFASKTLPVLQALEHRQKSGQNDQEELVEIAWPRYIADVLNAWPTCRTADTARL